MKPSKEQLETINQYLDSHSKYRETRAELYDHILSALEAVPISTPFSNAADHIIERLGGSKGIAVIEAAYKKTAIKAISKLYVKSILSYLQSPLILVIAAGSVLIYLMQEQLWVNVHTGVPIISLIPVIGVIPPLVLIFERVNNKTYCWDRDKKPSIINLVNVWLCFAPLYLGIATHLIPDIFRFFFSLSKNLDMYLSGILFLLVALHSLAFYAINKQRPKISIV